MAHRSRRSADGHQHADSDTQLVVHLNLRRTDQRHSDAVARNGDAARAEFWVAKWIVPNDAPTGIVRFTVSCEG